MDTPGRFSFLLKQYSESGVINVRGNGGSGGESQPFACTLHTQMQNDEHYTPTRARVQETPLQAAHSIGVHVPTHVRVCAGERKRVRERERKRFSISGALFLAPAPRVRSVGFSVRYGGERKRERVNTMVAACLVAVFIIAPTLV